MTEDDGFETVYPKPLTSKGVEVYGDAITFKGKGAAEIHMPHGPDRDEFVKLLESINVKSTDSRIDPDHVFPIGES